MAEIKSSLELALEKTKKFEISEKEREEIKRKDMIQKAESLSNRYREGSLSLKEVQKEIEKMEEKGAKEVLNYLLSKWIETLSLNLEDERLLDGIEGLRGRPMEEIKREFRVLMRSYEEEKEKIKRDAKAFILEELRKESFEGSAIVPRIEQSPFWEREKSRIDNSYQGKLRDFKEQIRRSL